MTSLHPDGNVAPPGLSCRVDLVADLIPVIGYADDDANVVAVALRSVARCAGLAALHRHWPGGPAGLAAVLRAAGIDGPASEPTRRPPRWRPP
jgi:hypothetical protein